MNNPPDERMFAVAVRDGEELFLRVRIRRAARGGDIYYSLPTGRSAPEWKKWDPHGSYHRDGRSHHKSFDRKALVRQSQKPDFGFKGWWPFIVISAERNDARDRYNLRPDQVCGGYTARPIRSSAIARPVANP